MPVHEIPFSRKGVNPVSEARCLLALWRLYARLRPELVHHITIKPILYGGLAARWLRLPAVVHAVTGLGYVFSRQGMAAGAARVALRYAYRQALDYRAATTIFQNPDDVLEIWGASGHPRARIIRGAGVDPAEYPYHEEPPGTPLVILASRMLWSKGVGDFIEAARRCRAAGLDSRFALVGDTDEGNPDAIPAECLRRWHAEGIVEWWGRRQDMPEVFRQSHVVALPTTYREGIPKVLIEAASTGRPLVATDMPGCREIVVDGANGYLVEPNCPQELYESLSKLIQNKNLRQRMGIRGRERVLDGFSLDDVITQTLDIYNELRH
jgi:glycosyltransferase involved in cell wall biosynthesis